MNRVVLTPETWASARAAAEPTIFLNAAKYKKLAQHWEACLRYHAWPVVHQTGPEVIWDPKTGLGSKLMNYEEFKARKDREELVYLQEDAAAIPHLNLSYWLPGIWDQLPILREKFWVSGPGLNTPLHYDPVETLHLMVTGTKSWTCYKPGIANYYPHPAGSEAPFISTVTPRSTLAEKPRFYKNAEAWDFYLNEGETLYLPAFWWHQVRSLDETNVSLNFVWETTWQRKLASFRQYWRCRRHKRAQLARAAALRAR